MPDDEDVLPAVYGWLPQVFARPVEPYLGLSLGEAAALATTEGCDVEDVTGYGAVTLDLRPYRLRVRLDPDGRVAAVHRG